MAAVSRQVNNLHGMATGFNKSMILKQSFVFDYASSAMKKPLYS